MEPGSELESSLPADTIVGARQQQAPSQAIHGFAGLFILSPGFPVTQTAAPFDVYSFH